MFVWLVSEFYKHMKRIYINYFKIELKSTESCYRSKIAKQLDNCSQHKSYILCKIKFYQVEKDAKGILLLLAVHRHAAVTPVVFTPDI